MLIQLSHNNFLLLGQKNLIKCVLFERFRQREKWEKGVGEGGIHPFPPSVREGGGVLQSEMVSPVV